MYFENQSGDWSIFLKNISLGLNDQYIRNLFKNSVRLLFFTFEKKFVLQNFF